MTTHLVIADVDTIVALEQSDPLIWECYHADRRCDCPMTNKLTGDTWLFRTPEQVRHAMYADGDPLRSLLPPWFVYEGRSPERSRVSPLLIHYSRVLPLIAACDLLGIEEL